MRRNRPDRPSSRRTYFIAICCVLWIAGVFACVVLFGEPVIGPKADSAAFIARLANFR